MGKHKTHHRLTRSNQQVLESEISSLFKRGKDDDHLFAEIQRAGSCPFKFGKNHVRTARTRLGLVHYYRTKTLRNGGHHLNNGNGNGRATIQMAINDLKRLRGDMDRVVRTVESAFGTIKCKLEGLV